ncbi:MAG: T9SS type A sorting domain-containing protein [Candidatus Cloacimonetes bacterium]|nr:T9SS type A sorting domain-containing protein [Candidatus Cloacimonadota bacterium]
MKKLLFFLIVLIGVALLTAEPPATPPSNYDDTDAGTESNPYQIDNLENLYWLSITQDVWGTPDLSFYFIQTADIDASDTENWDNGAGFNPIGLKIMGDNEEWVLTPFSGNYNGGFHTISNLYINRTGDLVRDKGLFGYIDNAHIEAVKLVDSEMYCTMNCGLLVGGGVNSTITLCSSSGVIEGEFSLGGLIGNQVDSVISRCYSEATVTGNDSCGGLMGLILDSEISNCYYYGILNFLVDHNGGLIGNCYNGNLISNCYVAGEIQNSTAGGLLGMINPNSNITNCFWDEESTGAEDYTEYYFGGTYSNVLGLQTIEMLNPATYTSAGWDFINVWATGLITNWGYPYLIENSPVANEENEISPIPMLSTNYPNPFSSMTTISFNLKQREKVTMYIYNIKGEKINTLVSDTMTSGNHTVNWQGTDSSNRRVASGVYFYKLVTKTQTSNGKMIYLK